MWKVLSLYKERFSPTDCVVSDREASTMTKPWPTKGYQAIIKKSVFNLDEITATL